MYFDFLFWYVLVSVFVFGAVCGSFLNCVIWRAYVNESAATGRSYCPKCRHRLAARDLVPLVSFFSLGGRCRYCKKPISWQYPLIEALTGVAFAAAAWQFVPGVFTGLFPALALAKLFIYWGIISTLIVIFVADLRWYFIPDGAVISGLFFAAALHAQQMAEAWTIIHRVETDILVNAALSAVLAGSFFLAIYMFSRGTWMGFGDVKYALFMGWLLGFPDVAVGLFLAFFFGAIIGLGLVAGQRKKMSSQVPFGPFLVCGTAAALFFAGPIIDWYWSISIGPNF
jgi:prepilin signal peptidase PulO-like enzyme (type II secretory pathway)